MYCHDLEVMSSNPSQVELGVRSTSICPKSYLIQKHKLVYTHFWLVGRIQMVHNGLKHWLKHSILDQQTQNVYHNYMISLDLPRPNRSRWTILTNFTSMVGPGCYLKLQDVNCKFYVFYSPSLVILWSHNISGLLPDGSMKWGDRNAIYKRSP